MHDKSPEGILLVNKPRGKTSFSLVRSLRRKLNVKKVGHAGTLDPFATGVMVLLVGRGFTRLSDRFLNQDKEYIAQVQLGVATDTYDTDGQIINESAHQPTHDEVKQALTYFQGTIQQIPPMFSAKKINGKKLYEIARKGEEVHREPVEVTLQTTLISYEYPYLNIHVKCSKGTYIRSVAHDLGTRLGCGGHLVHLQRIRSGCFHIKDCLDGEQLFCPEVSGDTIRSKLLNADSITSHYGLIAQ